MFGIFFLTDNPAIHACQGAGNSSGTPNTIDHKDWNLLLVSLRLEITAPVRLWLGEHLKKHASSSHFAECLLERGEHTYIYFEVAESISEVRLCSDALFLSQKLVSMRIYFMTVNHT